MRTKKFSICWYVSFLALKDIGVNEEDGGVVEGVNYWAYGFGYFTYFAETLRERTGEDLLADAREAAAFPAAVQLGPDRYPAFADSGRIQVLPTGLLSRLEKRLGIAVPRVERVPDFDFDHCYRWAHLTRTLTWTDRGLLNRAEPAAQGAWLERAQWLVDSRTVAGMPVAFAAKGGHNDESHNHNDIGHFILEAHGEELLADLGAGEYTGAYFGPRRYEALHSSAEGHSVPVLDGRTQQPGRDHAARVLFAQRSNDGARLELDLSAAYGSEAVLRREFHWRPDATLVLTDKFAGTARAEEIFISRLRPDTTEGQVIWAGARTRAVMRFDSARWHACTERLQTQNHHAEPDTVYRVRLASTAQLGNETFIFTIEPTDPR